MFKDEAENLRDVGNWQQFELYARGELAGARDVKMLYNICIYKCTTYAMGMLSCHRQSHRMLLESY
jgi:hypothetical protein